MYSASIPLMKKTLANIERWLDKAVAFAATKKFDPETLLVARLAPDQYNLTRQIQAACDAAKFTGSRLSGKEAPAHPDTEKTIAELKTRIQAAIAFLDTITEEDFAGAADRVIPLPFIPGMGMGGADYLNELSIPNFFFHVNMTYAILRHNGVDLGKQDYIGGLSLRPL